jgi:hypothetical protein
MPDDEVRRECPLQSSWVGTATGAVKGATLCKPSCALFIHGVIYGMDGTKYDDTHGWCALRILATALQSLATKFTE